MTSRSPLVHLLHAGGLLLAFASACGGRAVSQDGELGNVDLGGQGVGGSGGPKAQAGKNSGGSPSAAGSASAGAGSTNEACTAPPDPGPCDAYFPVWYHDASTGVCRPFVYGGCSGNFNRYSSLGECQKSCYDESAKYAGCQLPSDCMLASTSCCGVCDSPSFSGHDLISFNRKYQDQFECAFSAKLPPPSGNDASAPADCAPCSIAPDGTQKYFLPTCESGLCGVVDLRQSELTRCTSDADCRVRRGSDCCESCDVSELISVHGDGSFESFVCEGATVACPHCVPTPTDAIAFCGDDGHCALHYPSLK